MFIYFFICVDTIVVFNSSISRLSMHLNCIKQLKALYKTKGSRIFTRKFQSNSTRAFLRSITISKWPKWPASCNGIGEYMYMIAMQWAPAAVSQTHLRAPDSDDVIVAGSFFLILRGVQCNCSASLRWLKGVFSIHSPRVRMHIHLHACMLHATNNAPDARWLYT